MGILLLCYYSHRIIRQYIGIITFGGLMKYEGVKVENKKSIATNNDGN